MDVRATYQGAMSVSPGLWVYPLTDEGLALELTGKGTRYYKDEPMDELNKGLFAFASYNAGPARIRGLRKEAEKRGLKPNLWFNNVELVAAEKSRSRSGAPSAFSPRRWPGSGAPRSPEGKKCRRSHRRHRDALGFSSLRALFGGIPTVVWRAPEGHPAAVMMGLRRAADASTSAP